MQDRAYSYPSARREQASSLSSVASFALPFYVHLKENSAIAFAGRLTGAIGDEGRMSDLKLMALDTEDLDVISAYMQDSVFKVGDMSFAPKQEQFSLAANRFVWEQSDQRNKPYERHRSALVFKRVKAVRSSGIDRRKRDEVLSLLAIRFEQKGEGPDGTIQLALAANATIALDVECIEAQLADIGGAWETAHKPRHPDAG
jgi:hypothetical protein